MQKKKYTERVVEAEQMEFITYLEYSLNEIQKRERASYPHWAR